MAWRVVVIENPASLCLKNNKIAIKQEEEALIPLEDIDSIVLDSYGIQTSANLLIELARNNITVLICDEKHLPNSVLLPYSQHSRQAKISQKQLEMSVPLQKQIWQKIIKQKILNQMAVMKKLGHDSGELLQLAKEVKSGDNTNRESIAARLYFKAILDDATRQKIMWENSALNYGYAIVRSVLARCVASRGLVASQGIFHHNELNQFNLVDDLIEPFRPVADEYILDEVRKNRMKDENEDAKLTKEDRRMIVDLLNRRVLIGENKFGVKHATDMMVESLVKAMMTKEIDALTLPLIIK